MTPKKKPEKQATPPGVSPISGTAPPAEHQFKKGQSGNPGGVPKGMKSPTAALRRIFTLDYDEFIKLARDGAARQKWCKSAADWQAWRYIELAAQDHPDPAAKALVLRALEAITDRIDGKVATAITGEGGGSVSIVYSLAKPPAETQGPETEGESE